MKLKKLIAAGLIAVQMLGLLAGCGKGTDSAATDNTTDTNTSVEDNAESSEGTAEDGEQAVAGEVALPLTDETVTFRVWGKTNPMLLNLTDGDYNNSYYYTELEKRTNVHIEWVIPTSGSERDQLNLMISSGELCDMLYQTCDDRLRYNDGLDAAVDDGYYLDLSDMVKKYAPNYLAAIEDGGEKVRKGALTDAGRYVLIAAIQKEEQPPFMGTLVRQDWLDDLGLDTPVTYDDWEEMLTLFKEEKGATAPLALIKGEIWSYGEGMGAIGANFYQKDGKVYYGLYDDAEECKAYLALLNDWYNKGLIDPDFASSTSWISGEAALVTTGTTGVFQGMYTQPSTDYLPSMEEGAAFAAINPPVLNEGQELHYRTENQYMAGGYVISADCENPELALKWMDYQYTDEGYLLANFGIEGESYTMNENGEPKYTDVVLNNPDGLTPAYMIYLYGIAPGTASYYADWRGELQFVPAESAAYMDKWNEVDYEYFISSFAGMSAEENSEYTDIFTDLNTYVEENILQFITGAKSLDEYDDFVATLVDMDIERCIELKQAALDRYNAR